VEGEEEAVMSASWSDFASDPVESFDKWEERSGQAFALWPT
jgi:hypothetical protein